MIRFVDLSDAYWAGDEINMRESPCCAFLNTVTDRFLENQMGHVFTGPEDLDDLPDLKARLEGLMPPGFWAQAAKEKAGY